MGIAMKAILIANSLSSSRGSDTRTLSSHHHAIIIISKTQTTIYLWTQVLGDSQSITRTVTITTQRFNRQVLAMSSKAIPPSATENMTA